MSAPPELAELQRSFAAALLRGISPFTGDEPADGARNLAERLGLDADALAIHRETIAGTLHKALTLNFPAVRALVGSEFFEAAAREFIRQQPPTQACLNDYGASFPAFLAGFGPAASVSYLADVARLEWAVCRALHAPEALPADLQGLARLEPSEMARVCFEPHPAVSVLALTYAAESIWRAVLAEEGLAGDGAALAALDVAPRPHWVLVERGSEGVQVHALDAQGGGFLKRLCDSAPLASALSAYGPEPDAARIQAALAGHLAAGRLAAWHVLPEDGRPFGPE